MNDEWRQTACILCSLNCGIEVKLEGRRIARVHGNRRHVVSKGYACEKAQGLDYYQNSRDRLTTPSRRTGFHGEGFALGEALFDAVLKNRSGVLFTVDPYEETWKRVRTPEGRISVDIPELINELNSLRSEQPVHNPHFPFVLTAGDRRSTTANTAIRDPGWRPKDPHGSLRMNPQDAETLGVKPGGRVRITTQRASAEAVVEITTSMQPGHVTLPNGSGLWYPDREGQEFLHGVPPNELTDSAHRDWIAGTPFHKNVPARVKAITD
ncbi:MAG: hypothetical protein HY268_05900 [Deltaproteobacteria bacterium]|nr:hypothetical protein [Deltaproteobacteria bacterium]